MELNELKYTTGSIKSNKRVGRAEGVCDTRRDPDACYRNHRC